MPAEFLDFLRVRATVLPDKFGEGGVASERKAAADDAVCGEKLVYIRRCPQGPALLANCMATA